MLFGNGRQQKKNAAGTSERTIFYVFDTRNVPLGEITIEQSGSIKYV